MGSRNLWNREQTIIALNLYCKIPFNKVSSTHPEILRVANIINRTPNSVKMKIGNFGSFDSELKNRGIVGLGNTSKLDETIWNEFNENWEKLAYESELLIAQALKQPIENASNIEMSDVPLGKERDAIIKQRVNQNFFRSTILSSYNSKCCITGLSIPDLLIASHIIPWAKDAENRLNPRNGLCLNAMHDRAFDLGYITITTDFKVKISKYIYEYKRETAVSELFLMIDSKDIILPDKFIPCKEFLEYHNNNIFIK